MSDRKPNFNFASMFALLYNASRCCMDISEEKCSKCPFSDPFLRKDLFDFFGSGYLSCEFLRHFIIEFLFHCAFCNGIEDILLSCENGCAIIPIENVDSCPTEFLPF